jgi:site-specific DNA recombinase
VTTRVAGDVPITVWRLDDRDDDQLATEPGAGFASRLARRLVLTYTRHGETVIDLDGDIHLHRAATQTGRCYLAVTEPAAMPEPDQTRPPVSLVTLRWPRTAAPSQRDIRSRVNPPSAWVWSAMRTHEPLVTREIFEAASTVARFRKGSRSDATPRRHPQTKRTYALRSYLRCDICGRRAWGHTVRTCTYYRCSPDPKNHAHLPWYDAHPAHVVVREDELTTPLRRFFEQRVFGDSRELLLARAINEPATDDGLAARAAALTAEIASLQQRQDNLVRELESFEPSGDDDFDQAWRSGLQTRFRAVLAEQQRKKALLADLARESQTRPVVDPSLLDIVPQTHIDLGRLPEDRQRQV